MEAGQTCSAAEAATRLGMSKQAVIQRIKRGTLEGYKVDGAWRVVLPLPTTKVASVTLVPAEAGHLALVEQLRLENERLYQIVMELTTRLHTLPVGVAEPPQRRRWWRFWDRKGTG